MISVSKMPFQGILATDPSRNVSADAAAIPGGTYNPTNQVLPTVSNLPGTPVNSHVSLTPVSNTPRKTNQFAKSAPQSSPSATASDPSAPVQVCGRMGPDAMQLSSTQQYMSLVNQQPDVFDANQMSYSVPNGMMYPTSTGIPGSATTGFTKGKPMLYFNPQSCGYNDASGGRDPRLGYPLVYPYVPMIDPKDRLKKPRAEGCC